MALPSVAIERSIAVIVARALLARGGLLHDGAGALRVKLAGDVRLAYEALGALAPGAVKHHPTDGVVAARSTQRAGVAALAAVARLVQRAVVVGLASAGCCV